MEVLDLYWNNFQNNILLSLGEITSLRSLNLSSNNFKGSFPVEELKALEHLETLDVSSNDFSDPPKVQDFKSWKNLIILNLEGNVFNNNILPFVSTLTSLKTLNLGYNNLEASIFAEGITIL
uniref:Uncharacterized protein MANES_S064000 n=1 Tax=Rhizophora mucronata TaxID=61149 RepID=A0A2P2MW64_RHIMU